MSRVVNLSRWIPVFCATAIQISGTSTPSRSSVTMVCCFISLCAPPSGDGAHGCPCHRPINQAESRLPKHLASGHPVSFCPGKPRWHSRPPVRAWPSAGPFDSGEPPRLRGKPDSTALPPRRGGGSRDAWHGKCNRRDGGALWRAEQSGGRVAAKKDLITQVISTPNGPGP